MKFKKLIILFLCFSVISLCMGCNTKKSPEEQHASYAKYINLSDYSLVLGDDDVSYEIKGNATNNYPKEFQYVAIKLNFYDGKKIVYFLSLSVTNLKSKETKDFSGIIENKYKDLPYKLTVDFATVLGE